MDKDNKPQVSFLSWLSRSMFFGLVNLCRKFYDWFLMSDLLHSVLLGALALLRRAGMVHIAFICA